MAAHKQVIKFEEIENKAAKLNLRFSLAASAVIAVLVLLALFVNQAFAMPAAFIVMCFGRYLFTGTCPAVQLMGRLKKLLPGRSTQS